MKKILNIIEYISLTILLCITLTGCSVKVFTVQNNISQNTNTIESDLNLNNVNDENVINSNTNIDLSNIPEYTDKPYVVINNNEPYFTPEELTNKSYENYSDLDYFGRCGIAVASIGKDLMPTEDRETIGTVKPSGWQTVKYSGIDGNYLYNRCHLIGFQLTGENANKQNLITGTRYLNVDGMLPFENMVADYIKETNNHVLYRISPIFENDNLVASGVLMEAKSVEDNGDGVMFNVYCYNVQPGVTINYLTGESEGPEFIGTTISNENTSNTTLSSKYILNTSSKKFHDSNCGNAQDIKEKNKEESNLSREELVSKGYSPCGVCKP